MIRKPVTALSIKPKMSSTMLMALIAGGLFAVFTGLYFAYHQGKQSGYQQFKTDHAELTQIKNELANANTELKKLKSDLIFAQRQKQIQEEAYKQLNRAYANSEQKNAVLGSRLDFYRSIISPEDGQSGPVIQGLEYTYSDGELRFDVTLVQAIKHKQQVQGSVIVTLVESGEVTGRWPANSARSVNFQYFQQISGTINKPSIAGDAKMRVELQLQDGEKLERWFEVVLDGSPTS